MRQAVMLLTGVALLASAPARAGSQSSEDEAFQRRVFGRALAQAPMHACFGRAYDPEHLAAHPRQKVRFMRLLVVAKDGGVGIGPSYALTVDVAFRNSGARFQTGGFCPSLHDPAAAPGRVPAAHCGIDCDGGVIDVTLKDKGSVLVGIPGGASVASPATGKDGPRFGSDDKLFRLDKTALSDCLGLAAADEDKRAMERGE